MTDKTTALLTDPEPHSHIVYPSSDECRISEAVAVFAGTGLSKGDAVILVTTETRRGFIGTRLECGGHDLALLMSSGQLSFVDASSLLHSFLGDGMPERDRFQGIIGRIIQRAAVDPGTGKPRLVRVFGEMVSLLYMARNVAAAERLEEFWNELVDAYSISLFCAYSLGVHDALPASLIECHGHDLSSTLPQ
jgi:MEDS: MEthanogen/methylotroph, DcmR Sensory domain